MPPNYKRSYQKVYSDSQEYAILSEFTRTQGHCYLEHAGATLYSETQINNVLSDLKDNLFANPHARSTSSKVTEDSIDQIRYEILNHFKTSVDDYSVIFTSGCTGALKLIAETFNYNDGHFTYLQDNHTSVLGMRAYAKSVKLLQHDDAFQILNKNNTTDVSNGRNSLFVYPAQCNFSGTKYPLSWIQSVQSGALNQIEEVASQHWFCCLDAAAFVSTNPLDLSVYKPDFVCVSFYKMFGYPTGLGALLIKNTSAHVLNKKYYGGGTVFMALSLENIAIPRVITHERFEDGTIPFLSILSLKHGFDTLRRLKLSMELISQHTFELARYVYHSLSLLHHFNENPAVILYHDTNFEDRRCQGGIINFNLLRPNGDYIGYAEVLHIANLYGIDLRTGCFCNPGSCQRHLRLSTDDVKLHFERGHVCGDQNDLIDGCPTGSVRISFGYMSSKRDADEFLTMVEECFIVKPIVRKIPASYEAVAHKFHKKFSCGIQPKYKAEVQANKVKTTSEINTNGVTHGISGFLEDLFVYPVKSCAPFAVSDSWELCPTGLKYDREWMIVNHLGVCLTQKRNSRLCLIKPHIDVNRNTLQLSFKGLNDVTVPLSVNAKNIRHLFPCQSKVCGDHVLAWDCGDEVSEWLSKALNKPSLRLVRQCTDVNEIRTKNKTGETLSLANEAQFLLINKSSINWLMQRIPKSDFHSSMADLIKRFRPNFVVDFGKPFVENELQEVKFHDTVLKCHGQCARCQMICIDQSTGEKSVEPLRTLSKEFDGKIKFGVYLKRDVSAEYVEEISLKCSVCGS